MWTITALDMFYRHPLEYGLALDSVHFERVFSKDGYFDTGHNVAARQALHNILK